MFTIAFWLDKEVFWRVTFCVARMSDAGTDMIIKATRIVAADSWHGLWRHLMRTDENEADIAKQP